MFKAAVFMGFLAAVFYAGYWLGDHRLDDVRERMATISGELSEKTAALDREMTTLKRRAALAEARDALDRAREALADKNFGDAEREITAAVERLQAVAREAGTELQAALRPITDALGEMRRDVRAFKPRVQDQLRRLARRIDELSRQWE